MTHEFRADLHCHSTCSDGTLTPEELVRHAAEIGLKGLAITDHDTVAAYAMALPIANEIGIALIPGVEFSTSHKGVSVHILGYAFDTTHPTITTLCERHRDRRLHRNKAMLEKLAGLNMPLDPNILQQHTHTFGRPHIAQAMMEKGYVDSIADAFKRYLGEGRPAYVRGELFPVEDSIDILHQAHGLAVIAHPHLIDHPPTLKKLLDMPFDGIECYYSKFPADRHIPWIAIAEKKGWLMTGGSDFHGSVKPNVPLGCSWVNETTFNRIKEHDDSL